MSLKHLSIIGNNAEPIVKNIKSDNLTDTNTLRIRNNASTGYILTSSDDTGLAVWTNVIAAGLVDSVSGASNIICNPIIGNVVVTLDNNVSITSLTATSLTGAIQTAAQTLITSVGALTGLTMGGNINMQSNDIFSNNGAVIGIGTATVPRNGILGNRAILGLHGFSNHPTQPGIEWTTNSSDNPNLMIGSNIGGSSFVLYNSYINGFLTYRYSDSGFNPYAIMNASNTLKLQYAGLGTIDDPITFLDGYSLDATGLSTIKAINMGGTLNLVNNIITNVNTISANSITLQTTGGTASALNYYESGSGGLDWSGAFVKIGVLYNFTRIGKFISISFSQIFADSGAVLANILNSTPLPSRLWPNFTIFNNSLGSDNSMGALVSSAINNIGIIQIGAGNGINNFTAEAATTGCGTYAFSLSYSTV